MCDHSSQDEMLAEARKLLDQVKAADHNLTQDVSHFIQTETSKVLSEGRGTDTTLFFDVSGSMGTDSHGPWDKQRKIIKAIVPTAKEFDGDGIDLIPIMEKNPMELGPMTGIKDAGVAMKFVDKFRGKLLGSTPTRGLFEAYIDDHVDACIRDSNTKRLNIVIITDGEPSDLHNPSMTKTTEKATVRLRKHDLSPKEYLGVSYVIVTEDFKTMANYRKLDNRTMWGPDDNKVECDLSNAIYPFIITALGGPDKQVVINLILAGNKSEALDRAAEKLLQGVPKQLIEHMDAYIEAGFAVEV
ncbi:hypothetical protein FANTH_14512 [Fusarium anthophilum]|uniref:VWFA domain-containing protein n=1 Tax=Fusarium anthophilum TaxID=48485 RepID=A0A8H4YIE8_9HYPO|nr:hypothetical protein FANTH_14512 [Fusarium anthophilum]